MNHPVVLQVLRYARALRWLIRDLWREAGAKWLGTVAAGTIGVLIQGSVIGLVIVFAQRLQSDATLQFLGRELPSRSPQALLLVAAMVLVSLSISAFLIFLQNWLVMHTGYKYEDICRERVFLSLGIRPRRSGSRAPDLPGDVEIMQLGNVDASQVNRAVRVLMIAPVWAFTFVGATVMMFYVSLLLSTLILPIMIIALVLIYRLNVRAAAASLRFEKENPDARRQFRLAFQLLKETDRPIGRDTDFVRELLRGGSAERLLAANLERILAPQRAMLIANILLAACVALILLYFGLRVLEGSPGQWGYLVGYMVALTYCLNSLRTIATQLTTLNRFYPNVRRVHEFLSAAEETAGQPVTRFTVEPAGMEELGGLALLDVVRGKFIGLVTADQLNRYTFPDIVSSLAEAADCSTEALLASSGFVVRSSSDLGSQPSAVRRGHQQTVWQDFRTVAELKSQIDDAEIWNWLVGEVPALSAEGAEVSGLTIPGVGAKFVITAAAVMRSGKPFVFIDEVGMRGLPAEWRWRFLEHLRGRALFIVYGAGWRTISQYGENAVAILAGSRLVAALEPQDALSRLAAIERIVTEQKRTGLAEDIEELDEAAA